MKLTEEFYAMDTVLAARALLGKYLVRMDGAAPLVCRITQTEAYVGAIDKACHAYGYKRTPRTQIMFAPGGRAYIYLIYGMYHCLNFVTGPEGEPNAVLLRGAQVRHNGDIIAQNRFGCKRSGLSARQERDLLNGPGRLCKGLALTRAQNGLSLLGDELYVTDSLADLGLPPWPGDGEPLYIKAGERIGVDYAGECARFPWRFTL